MYLRAIELSEETGLEDALGNELAELGELYDSEGRVPELLAVWDRIEALPTHSGLRGRLADNLSRRASEHFQEGRYRESFGLISRLERHNKGARYDDEILEELLYPDWVPDLYEQLGDSNRAERIHLERIRVARAIDDRLQLADRLDDYAYFLRARGRLDESASLLAEAAQIRIDGVRQILSTEHPRGK